MVFLLSLQDEKYELSLVWLISSPCFTRAEERGTPVGNRNLLKKEKKKKTYAYTHARIRERFLLTREILSPHTPILRALGTQPFIQYSGTFCLAFPLKTWPLLPFVDHPFPPVRPHALVTQFTYSFRFSNAFGAVREGEECWEIKSFEIFVRVSSLEMRRVTCAEKTLVIKFPRTFAPSYIYARVSSPMGIKDIFRFHAEDISCWGCSIRFTFAFTSTPSFHSIYILRVHCNAGEPRQPRYVKVAEEKYSGAL